MVSERVGTFVWERDTLHFLYELWHESMHSGEGFKAWCGEVLVARQTTPTSIVVRPSIIYKIK